MTFTLVLAVLLPQKNAKIAKKRVSFPHFNNPCSAIVNQCAEGLTIDEQGMPIVEGKGNDLIALQSYRSNSFPPIAQNVACAFGSTKI